MNGFSGGPHQSERDIFTDDISDEALERAAGNGRTEMDNPTAPFALICVPFEAERR